MAALEMAFDDDLMQLMDQDADDLMFAASMDGGLLDESASDSASWDLLAAVKDHTAHEKSVDFGSFDGEDQSVLDALMIDASELLDPVQDDDTNCALFPSTPSTTTMTEDETDHDALSSPSPSHYAATTESEQEEEEEDIPKKSKKQTWASAAQATAIKDEPLEEGEEVKHKKRRADHKSEEEMQVSSRHSLYISPPLCACTGAESMYACHSCRPRWI